MDATGLQIHVPNTSLHTFLEHILLINNYDAHGDFYLGMVTFALIFLMVRQLRLFTRPQPVPKKVLPLRPALQIYFRPHDVISGNTTSSSTSAGGNGGDGGGSTTPARSTRTVNSGYNNTKDKPSIITSTNISDNISNKGNNNDEDAYRRISRTSSGISDSSAKQSSRIRIKANKFGSRLRQRFNRKLNDSDDLLIQHDDANGEKEEIVKEIIFSKSQDTNESDDLLSYDDQQEDDDGDDISIDTIEEPQQPPSTPNKNNTNINDASFLDDLPDNFAPLLSSSKMDTCFNDLTIDLLHAVHAKAHVRLRPGRHEIPLDKDSSRPQLALDVPSSSTTSSTSASGCRMTAVAAIGSDGFTSSDDLDVTKSTCERSQSMVKHAGIVLDPPLPLINVAPTLIHFPTLFEDNAVKYTLRRIQIVRYALEFITSIRNFLEKMLWIIESKCQIHLGKISVTPLYKGRQHSSHDKEMMDQRHANHRNSEPEWRLSLSFSGHVLLFGWIPIPFVGITLPTFIIPQPHALLEYLMTSQPLASAKLHRERIAEERIVLALASAVETWDVKAEAVMTPPALSVDITLPGGLTVAVEAMHGRDVSGGRARKSPAGKQERGVYGHNGGNNSGASISDSISSCTYQDNVQGLRLRRNKVRNIGSQSIPLSKAFDANALVPWKFSFALKGRIERDTISIKVSNFSAVHHKIESIESTGGILYSSQHGSNLSLSGNIVICKPNAKLLSQMANESKMAHKMDLIPDSDAKSVCSMLLLPEKHTSSSLNNQRWNNLLQYDYAFDVDKDTYFDAISLSIGASHPMLKGGTIITSICEGLYWKGSLSARENAVFEVKEIRQKRNILKHLPALDVVAGINNIYIPDESFSYSDDGQTKCIPELNGGQMMIRVVGGFMEEKENSTAVNSFGTSRTDDLSSWSNHESMTSDGLFASEGIKVSVDFGIDSLVLHNETNVPEFPELDIFDDQKLETFMSGAINGTICIHLRPQVIDGASISSLGKGMINPLEAYEIDFSKSLVQLKISEANSTLGHRKILTPSESTFGVSIVESIVDMSFEGRTQCEFQWDFQGSSPILQVTSVGKNPSNTSHEEREQISILINSLRQGRFKINVSSVGGLTITQAATSREDREGLYDWKFFNSFVSPDDTSLSHMLKVIHDKPTIDKLLQVIKLINGDLERLLRYILKQVYRAKDIFDEENIDEAGEAIPGHKMSRLLSLFLSGDAKETESILPIVSRVVAGEGVDVVGVKELMRKNLIMYEEFAPEIDRLIRWAEILLGPMEGPKPYVEKDVSPLSEIPQYKNRFVDAYPSAKEIYATLLERKQLPLEKNFSNMVSSIAPYFSFKQIEYILHSRPPSDWQPSDIRRLRYIYTMKKKVLDISESYGGLSFMPQSFSVSVFVGEATRASIRLRNTTYKVQRSKPLEKKSVKKKQERSSTLHSLRKRRMVAPSNYNFDATMLTPAGRVASQNDIPGIMKSSTKPKMGTRTEISANTDDNIFDVGDSLLGPQDVAILLQAGLTSSLKGSTVVQLNQRMLLDLMASQPRMFAVSVLAEISSPGGQGSPRGLTSALMALMDLDQSSFLPFHRLDMPSLLESWLPGLKIPRREDYLAGGRWARQSYYNAAFMVAKNILDESEIYMAFKGHIQRVRHSKEIDPILTAREIEKGSELSLTNNKLSKAVDTAKMAIHLADEKGAKVLAMFNNRNDKSIDTESPCTVNEDNTINHDEVESTLKDETLVDKKIDDKGQFVGASMNEDGSKEISLVATSDSEPNEQTEQCEDGSCGTTESLSQARKAAIDLYRKAFDACAAVIKMDKLAFHVDWFKSFYRRNYDALMVKSIYDNVIDNVDEVREWMDCLLNQQQKTATEKDNDGAHDLPLKTDFFKTAEDQPEQGIIDKIIDLIFYYGEEQDAIRKDPLVRLLISNPPGQYDFTVVTAMGVITEGKKGLELVDALERLEKIRGVKTIRADTGTARSLEFNGAKIEDAIESAVQLKKPYGLLGYSQGSANALTAESSLLSGSPRQQQNLVNPGAHLVCRQLLFSAANGSMHGPSTEVKIHRLIVMSEEFFKYQQGYCSRAFISLVLETITSLMDSAPFQKVICGGGGTFLFEGSRAFWREAQHLPQIPTCVLRGVLDHHTTPESLDMLSNMLSKQAGSPLHDSQVHVYDAVGHPVYTQNRNGKILKTCDMGGAVQRTHHWSPLSDEVKFVQTKRDIDNGSFMCAKDRHVFPWCDVNARFGIIKYASDQHDNKQDDDK